MPLAKFRLASLMVFVATVSSLQESVAVEPPGSEVSGGYNFYQGGDLTVQGPAVIMKKDLANRMGLEAGYRVDMISSASIDVVTQASVRSYEENRTEYSVGLDYLQGEGLLGLDFSNSRESDYESDTLSAGMSRDFLGQNLTLNLRVARSWDRVGKNNDPSFGWKEFDRTAYAVGLAQSLSPRFLVQLNYELTADDGFINNPYRNALTVDGAWVPERYPDARTGHAWTFRAAYGLVPRVYERSVPGPPGNLSSLQFEYRYYRDTFDIDAHSGQVRFQKYFQHAWLVGLSYYYHRQNEASFYGDRLPADQEYLSRDKELSRFVEQGIGLSIKYGPRTVRWNWMDRPFVQLVYSYLWFKYDNFTDPRDGDPYNLAANVIHASVGFDY